LWLPALRCFGILQISPFRSVFVLHGSGVGGGSLGYANVLMQPTDDLFAHPSWKHLADWKALLLPHYDTARFMLGVDTNPCMWPADGTLLGCCRTGRRIVSVRRRWELSLAILKRGGGTRSLF
jgi:cholesterol oxidase